MRHIVAPFLVLLALPSVSQEAKSGATDRILSSARDRMVRQNDAWFHEGVFLPVIQNQEILVALDPNDEETWSVLSWMYQNIEDPGSQWVTTRRFAQANPTYVDAKYYEAEFLFAKKMYAKVPSLLEPLVKSDPPPDANVFRFLAHSYNRMGYYEDALRVWDAYLKSHPNDGQAKVNRQRVADTIKK